ncbi:hypothetical protein H0H93_012356, partial [Arthromyces matolae]
MVVFLERVGRHITRADGMQVLSFALCHVYARATRSVSIPAPVYCKFYLTFTTQTSKLVCPDADIVCSRAKHHYDPRESLDLSETATITG